MRAETVTEDMGFDKDEAAERAHQYSWIERIWGRLRVKDGDKVEYIESGPARMDKMIIGDSVNSMKGPAYSEFMKDPQRMGLVEVPKALLDSKSKYTKWHDLKGSSGKKVKHWKGQRTRFFWAIVEYMERVDAEKRNSEFDRTLRYFARAIGPIVEEAFFINEALNNMKGYLGYWAQTSQKEELGVVLNVWPPREVQGADNFQLVDYVTPNSQITNLGYNIYTFIKDAHAEKSYAQALQEGKDGIMLVTMLEYIRQLSVRRNRNTKVMVGTFIRSDIPGADLDCEGAKASLEFAQELSTVVGWSRKSGIWHFK